MEKAFALLWVKDVVVQVLPVGAAVEDEWSKDRLMDWAEALVTMMPVDDDISRITLHHMDDVYTDVDRG